MKEFRSIFKQDFADYIETNQGTISNDTLRNTRSVLLTFDSLLAKENTGEISEAIVNQWIKRLHQVNAPKPLTCYGWRFYDKDQVKIDTFCGVFGVSRSAAAIRLEQLGYLNRKKDYEYRDPLEVWP